MRLVWIGASGAAGAIARYLVDGWIANRARGAFPLGTFVVNASGCLLLGFVFALLTERYAPNPAVRTAVTIGFLGAYTTFSTFALETVRLLEDGALLLGLLNVAGSVVAGVAAAFAGLMLGRAV